MTSDHPLTSALADVIRNETSSLWVVAAAGEFIATDAIFNLWTLRGIKADSSSRNDEQAFALLEEYERICGACRSALVEWRETPATPTRDRTLVRALREAHHSLAKYVGEVSVESFMTDDRAGREV